MRKMFGSGKGEGDALSKGGPEKEKGVKPELRSLGTRRGRQSQWHSFLKHYDERCLKWKGQAKEARKKQRVSRVPWRG